MARAEHRGCVQFVFDDKPEANQNCFLFVADADRDCSGEPTESEEMQPRWFKQSDIPFDEMWFVSRCVLALAA